MCPFIEAKGIHLFIAYQEAATGKTRECCYGCGIYLEED